VSTNLPARIKESSPIHWVVRVAAVAAIVLALGPNPAAAGQRFWDKAPYFFLLKLPGVLSLRVPARFGMMAAFALAVAGGFALTRLVDGRRRRGLLVALAAAGVLFDGWLDRIPLLPAPQPLDVPHAAAAVLELPLDEERDAAAMFRQIGHGVPVLNGYSGYHPPSYHAVRLGAGRLDSGLFAAVAAHGPILVVVDGAAASAPLFDELLRAQPGTEPLPPQGERLLYLLPRRTPPAPPRLGPRIELALERSSPQRAVFELRPPADLGGFVLSFGAGVSHLPAGVTIEVAQVQGRWTTVWSDRVAGLAFHAALRAPATVPIAVEAIYEQARFVRVQTHGPWTIERVEARAPAADAAPPSPASPAPPAGDRSTRAP
jgi:hypothetical protein